MLRIIGFWISTLVAIAVLSVLFSWSKDSTPALILVSASSLFSFLSGLLAKST